MKINGKKVNNLVTKFFCKEGNLHYQILFELENEEIVVYREFNNHSDYKKVYNHLIDFRFVKPTFENKINTPKKTLLENA